MATAAIERCVAALALRVRDGGIHGHALTEVRTLGIATRRGVEVAQEKSAIRHLRIPLRFLHATALCSLYLPPVDDWGPPKPCSPIPLVGNQRLPNLIVFSLRQTNAGRQNRKGEATVFYEKTVTLFTMIPRHIIRSRTTIRFPRHHKQEVA